MKTIFLLLLAVCIAINAFAQKITLNEVDKFTGKKIIKTSEIKTSRPNVNYKLCNINDTIYLHAAIKNIKVEDNKDAPIKIYIIISDGGHVNCEGIIKSMNGKEIHSGGLYWGGIMSGSTHKLTDVALRFIIHKESLDMLCNNEITDIRISIFNSKYGLRSRRFYGKKIH